MHGTISDRKVDYLMSLIKYYEHASGYTTLLSAAKHRGVSPIMVFLSKPEKSIKAFIGQKKIVHIVITNHTSTADDVDNVTVLCLERSGLPKVFKFTQPLFLAGSLILDRRTLTSSLCAYSWKLLTKAPSTRRKERKVINWGTFGCFVKWHSCCLCVYMCAYVHACERACAHGCVLQ